MPSCAPEYPTRVQRSKQALTGVAYASGDQVGALNTYDVVQEAGTKAGVAITVMGALNSTETPALDIWFFEREPTTVSADNVAASFNDSAVLDHFLGHVEIAASDWSADANHAVFTTTTTLALFHFQEGQPGRIWAAVIARAAFTPVTLTIGIGVLVD